MQIWEKYLNWTLNEQYSKFLTGFFATPNQYIAPFFGTFKWSFAHRRQVLTRTVASSPKTATLVTTWASSTPRKWGPCARRQSRTAAPLRPSLPRACKVAAAKSFHQQTIWKMFTSMDWMRFMKIILNCRSSQNHPGGWRSVHRWRGSDWIRQSWKALVGFSVARWRHRTWHCYSRSVFIF